MKLFCCEEYYKELSAQSLSSFNFTIKSYIVNSSIHVSKGSACLFIAKISTLLNISISCSLTHGRFPARDIVITKYYKMDIDNSGYWILIPTTVSDLYYFYYRHTV